jgi:hypothetical protein
MNQVHGDGVRQQCEALLQQPTRRPRDSRLCAQVELTDIISEFHIMFLEIRYLFS